MTLSWLAVLLAAWACLGTANPIAPELPAPGVEETVEARRPHRGRAQHAALLIPPAPGAARAERVEYRAAGTRAPGPAAPGVRRAPVSRSHPAPPAPDPTEDH
jgi:hypothetical protein